MMDAKIIAVFGNHTSQLTVLSQMDPSGFSSLTLSHIYIE